CDRLQPVLPRHAGARRVPGAQCVRGRVHLQRARSGRARAHLRGRARRVRRSGRGRVNEPRSRFFEPEFEPRVTAGWRARWFDIVFHHDSKPARNFDVLLIVAIIASVIVVILDSEAGLQARWSDTFYALEWGFTLLFTAEYLLRLSL